MQKLGRYTLFAKIASGGMATVHFARLAGEAGFTRTVAVKRLHKHLARDPEFAGMFLDEARLAARVRHPNVVATLDVESHDGELFVVMEYVHGEPLSRLIRFVAGEVERIPFDIVSAIMTNVLAGLHAAHEIRDKRGAPIDLVHRDVSPQNILVGADGVTRVLDFGVAKARGRMQETLDGKVKGKVGYMSPEQLRGMHVDRRTDIYAAGVVFWELLTLVRLFANKSDATTLENALQRRVEPPSAFASDVPPALDAIVMRALARDPADRFDTAKQMATALEEAMSVASQATVAEWVETIAHKTLARRAEILADIERGTTKTFMPPQDVSEPSSISAATPVRRARARRVWGLALAATALVVALASTAIRFAPNRETHTQPAAVAEPSTTRVATSAPTASTSIAMPSVTPSSDASNAASTTSTKMARHPPSRPGARCDPPYVVGSDGIRHYKMECLP